MKVGLRDEAVKAIQSIQQAPSLRFEENAQSSQRFQTFLRRSQPPSFFVDEEQFRRYFDS